MKWIQIGEVPHPVMHVLEGTSFRVERSGRGVWRAWDALDKSLGGTLPTKVHLTCAEAKRYCEEWVGR